MNFIDKIKEQGHYLDSISIFCERSVCYKQPAWMSIEPTMKELQYVEYTWSSYSIRSLLRNDTEFTKQIKASLHSLPNLRTRMLAEAMGPTMCSGCASSALNPAYLSQHQNCC